MSFNLVDYLEAVRDHFAEFKTEKGKKLSRVSSISGLEEFLSTLPHNSKNLHIIAVVQPDGVLQDPNRSDNYADVPYYRFYIVGHAKLLDADAKADLINRCKKTGLKIIGKMLKDRIARKNGLQGFEFDRIPYQGIGPFGNNYYGVEFSFNVSASADLQIDTLTKEEDFEL